MSNFKDSWFKSFNNFLKVNSKKYYLPFHNGKSLYVYLQVQSLPSPGAKCLNILKTDTVNQIVIGVEGVNPLYRAILYVCYL